ncbi:hypothetical protein LINPERHAP1_LOCUS30774 [Linum perenne]
MSISEPPSLHRAAEEEGPPLRSLQDRREEEPSHRRENRWPRRELRRLHRMPDFLEKG